MTADYPAGFVSFDYHVAAAVQTAQGDFLVLDPALDPNRPLALRRWYERLADSIDAPLNYSCLDYFAIRSEQQPGINPVARCRDNPPAALDALGNLRVDFLSDIRGTVCDEAFCIPQG